MQTRLVQPQSSFDSIALSAVAVECRALLGARVQRVHQTAPEGFALVMRARAAARAIAISVHGRWPRVIVTRDVPQIGAGSFAQLLRSRLEGAPLRAIETVAFERVIALTFETLEGPMEVVVELMGRAANAVLCAGDIIVGVMRAVRSRERELLPQRRYVRPGPPARHPLTVTAADLAAAGDLAAASGDPMGSQAAAWRTVLGVVSGIGPALAWEACLRAGVEPSTQWAAEAAPAVAREIRAIGERAAAQNFVPHVYRDGRGDAVAFAPFPFECYAALRAEPASMSDAVEAVTARVVSAAGRDAVRSGLAATVAAATTRTRRALAAVADDLRAADGAEGMRRQGELLLAYLPQIAPGAASIEVPGFDGSPVSIRLDPRRTGVGNAQAYFKQYARATGARKRLPDRQAALATELAFLEAAANAIQHAESDDDLWEVEQDLIAAGLRSRAGRRGPAEQRGPTKHRAGGDRNRRRPKAVDAGRAFDVAGCRVRVGRSARENDYLTFDVAAPDDLWLHARGMPGAHAILTDCRAAPPESTITIAAAIAAFYSSGREAAKVPVDVTARKYVRRTRGGRPGQVHYTHERTLMVTPALPAFPR
jgi:predicted ribosome quality control (RQC) complex YloA/Tae2 family protein